MLVFAGARVRVHGKSAGQIMFLRRGWPENLCRSWLVPPNRRRPLSLASIAAEVLEQRSLLAATLFESATGLLTVRVTNATGESFRLARGTLGEVLLNGGTVRQDARNAWPAA